MIGERHSLVLVTLREEMSLYLISRGCYQLTRLYDFLPASLSGSDIESEPRGKSDPRLGLEKVGR